MTKVPETIGDVVRMGAVDLRVVCKVCAHSTEKSVYSRALDDDALRIDALRKKLRCTKCGAAEPTIEPHFPKPAYGGYPTTWGIKCAPIFPFKDATKKSR